jgi:hypothetical protein
MFDRASLHTLVDALPDEALDAAFRVLENYQKHPPSKAESDFHELHKKSRESFLRSTRNRARRTGQEVNSLLSGCMGPDGYGTASASGWEGQTRLMSKVVFFRGSELYTAERISLSDDRRKLIYSIEAKLVDGVSERHEFAFSVST